MITRARGEENKRKSCLWPIIRSACEACVTALHLQTSNVAARGAEQRKRLVGKSLQRDQD